MHSRTFLTVLTALLITGASSARADEQGRRILDRMLNAHGGLKAWKQFDRFDYDVRDFPLGANAPFDYRQVNDLRLRRHLVTGANYTAGFDGEQAWVTPSVDSLGVPPRFFLSGNFYFVAMPFVFGDPGLTATSLGQQTYDDQMYDVVRISFGQGIGDTHHDDYVLYIDAKTHQLRMTHFGVTYPVIRGDKPVNQAPRSALVFDRWQNVSGLTLPATIAYHTWSDGKLQGKPKAFNVINIALQRAQPNAQLFAAPDDAVIDQSHEAH